MPVASIVTYHPVLLNTRGC